MKFTVSTKPLVSALNLGIVNSNISKFFQKSNVAEVSVSGNDLRINLEASRIVTELTLRGSNDDPNPETNIGVAVVDCSVLKTLMNTIETTEVSLEFLETCLIVTAGRSKFTLPKVLEDTDVNLRRPNLVDCGDPHDVDKSGWVYIRDHQMYAIGLSFTHAVYTKVYLGDDGTVIVGDFDNSIFTSSAKAGLGTTCLLPHTVINMFASLPDGATIASCGRSYVVSVCTDGFDMTTQFEPYYESDADTGSYKAEVILGTMAVPEGANPIVISPAEALKILRQALILFTGSRKVITMEVTDTDVIFRDANTNGRIRLPVAPHDTFTLDFDLTFLIPAISKYEDETVKIFPARQGDEIVGIILHSSEMTTVLAGVE